MVTTFILDLLVMLRIGIRAPKLWEGEQLKTCPDFESVLQWFCSGLCSEVSNGRTCDKNAVFYMRPRENSEQAF